MCSPVCLSRLCARRGAAWRAVACSVLHSGFPSHTLLIEGPALGFGGMGHGGWLTSELAAESLVASIAALRIESASIAAADEFELTW